MNTLHTVNTSSLLKFVFFIEEHAVKCSREPCTLFFFLNLLGNFMPTGMEMMKPNILDVFVNSGEKQ